MSERIGGLQSPVIRAWRHRHLLLLRIKKKTTLRHNVQASTRLSFSYVQTLQLGEEETTKLARDSIEPLTLE